MQIHPPLRNLKLKGRSDISQMFGENRLPIYKNLGMRGHNGIDFGRPNGDDVLAAHDGTVTAVQTNKEDLAGIYVRVKAYPVYWDMEENTIIETCYFHLLDTTVKPNIKVRAGDVIGHVDNTGHSTGPHLHFGIRPWYYYKNGNYWKPDWKNGYLGYIDPYSHLAATIGIPIEKRIDDGLYRARDEQIVYFIRTKVRYGIPDQKTLDFWHNLGTWDKENIKIVSKGFIQTLPRGEDIISQRKKKLLERLLNK